MRSSTIVLSLFLSYLGCVMYLPAQISTNVSHTPTGTTDLSIKPNQARINVGPNINTGFSELQPVVSGDEQLLFFVRKGDTQNVGYAVRPLDEDIWYSIRQTDGTWGPAQHMPEPFNTRSYDGIKALSRDGKHIYLQNKYFPDGSRDKGFSVSELQKDGTWGFPIPLDIDQYSNDTNIASFCISTDESTIILSLKRPEGKGMQDLYVSSRLEKYHYSKPVNIGFLNTEGDEVSPYIGFDDRTLYFSTNSWGAGGGGMYDVFVSRRQDKTWLKWTVPQKLPYPVNTPSSDFYFSVSSQGDTAYVSSWHETSTRGYGRADLWKCYVPPGFRPGELYRPPGNSNMPPTFGDTVPDLTPGSLFRLDNVFFDVDRATLRHESVGTLNKLVSIMKQNPTLHIELQGHTDALSSDDHNLDLSGARAITVKQYLVARGITADRLEAKGYGESIPIAPNTTTAGRQLNRRVMVLVKSI